MLHLLLTESAALNDVESFRHIEKLANAGVRIAIDDFGTGLTRFDYVAKFNINVLKIDKSIIVAYRHAPRTYLKLLKAITAVANGCGFEVIAEGVEHDYEVALLKENFGINTYQGWLFGEAVPSDEFFQKHTQFRN